MAKKTTKTPTPLNAAAAEHLAATGRPDAAGGFPADDPAEQVARLEVQNEDELEAIEKFLDAEPDVNEGAVSIDDIVAAFGAATLRVQKAEQLLAKTNNENQRLRTTLRNVVKRVKDLEAQLAKSRK